MALALSVALVGCTSTTQYTLTIASSDGGSVFPAAGKHTYSAGQVIDIKATPASEFYQFVNWTGDVSKVADPSAATTSVTMEGDYSIKANFEALPWDTTIELSFHGTISERASIVELIIKPWIAQVEALTGTKGGKFDIVEDGYGDAPFDATTSLSGIASGIVDMGQLNPDTFHLGSLGYLPWFFPTIESTAYTFHKLLRDEVDTWDVNGELSGVKIMIIAALWPVQWWGNVEVKAPANLDGVVVRAEGAETLTLQALGAEPYYLGTSDLGGALQTGIVEGCFFTYSGIGGFSGVGPFTDYVTELNMFYRPYAIAMYKPSYDGLPAEAKAALDSLCTPQESVDLALAHLAGQAEDRDATIADPDHTFYQVTDFTAWKAATAGVKDQWIAMMDGYGFDGQAIYNRAVELIAQTPS